MTGDCYTESHLQQVLAEDGRVAELGIRAIPLPGGGFALCGEVESPARRAAIEQVIAESFPGLTVRSDIAVTRVGEPYEVEEL